MSLSHYSPLQPFVDRLVRRSNLGQSERNALLSLPAYAAQVKTNYDFVRLGEAVSHSSFIVDGLVGRFGQIRDGRRQITSVHIATDMIDLHSVVAPEACSALQALSVTTILKVPHAALRDVARRFPDLAEAFWRECVGHSEMLAEWVVNVGRRDATSRMAHLLCEIVCRTEAMSGKGAEISFAATQAHMSDMLGLTSVHTNRVLQTLRRDRIVSIEGRMIRVHDWARLSELAEFDPAYLKLPLSGAVEETRREATGS